MQSNLTSLTLLTLTKTTCDAELLLAMLNLRLTDCIALREVNAYLANRLEKNFAFNKFCDGLFTQ